MGVVFIKKISPDSNFTSHGGMTDQNDLYINVCVR